MPITAFIVYVKLRGNKVALVFLIFVRYLDDDDGRGLARGLPLVYLQ